MVSALPTLLKRVDLGLERDDLDLLRVALDLESVDDVGAAVTRHSLFGGDDEYSYLNEATGVVVGRWRFRPPSRARLALSA